MTTSSFDELMRMLTLQECIVDAENTRDAIENQINGVLAKQQPVPVEAHGVELTGVKRCVATERKLLRAAQTRRNELQESIRLRREAMEEGRATQKRVDEYLGGARDKLEESRKLAQQIREDIRGQRRRICRDLASIFPIEPTDPFKFTIRGDFESAAQVVYMLSFYLATPLPYPIKPFGNAFVQDPISVIQGPRTFTLNSKGGYRYDYAVFLLNKDIEFLMAREGLKTVDLRHTLPNIKYLLYVLTEGTIPARKRINH